MLFPQKSPVLCVQCKIDITKERHKLCVDITNGGRWLCLDCNGDNWDKKRLEDLKKKAIKQKTIEDLESLWKEYRPKFLDRWRQDQPERFEVIRLFFADVKTRIQK